jgi:hypothetical protein
MVNSQAS